MATQPRSSQDWGSQTPLFSQVRDSELELIRPSRDSDRTLGRARSLLRARWVQLSYLAIDALCLTVNSIAVLSLRFASTISRTLSHGGLLEALRLGFVKEYFAFLLPYVVVTVLLCEGYGLYRTSRMRSSLDESFAVFKAVGVAGMLLIVSIYVSNVDNISRVVVGCSGVLNFLCLAGWRLWKRRIIDRRIAKGVGVRNVLIIGAEASGRELAHLLQTNHNWGYTFKGFLDSCETQPDVLGRIEDFAQVVRAQFIDELFITLPMPREEVRQLTLTARRYRLGVKLIPDLYDGLAAGAPLRYMGGIPVLHLHEEPLPTFELFLKRVIDVVLSVCALTLISPLLASIAIAIKLGSTGPVLYRSQRVGKKGRFFVCYKFRTMVANADELKATLRLLNERQGPFFKLKNDPRITRVGKWLRKYSLDELPQLWNVVCGDMSLVGPRPHPLDDYKEYSLDHLRRLDVIPGITGRWQVKARRDPSFETNMALDLEYIENWDIWSDLKILLQTIPVVLRGVGE